MALVLWGLLATGAAGAADHDPEQAWADLLAKRVREGQPVWLRADAKKVLAIYDQAQTGHAKGAVIILHDMGQHPDWPQVVRPLRIRLPRHGWSTLSVQMPVRGRDQPMDQYGPLFDHVAPRLNAAIAYLKQHQVDNVVLAGYGLGAAMGAAYLAAQKSSDVKAFVGISMGAVAGHDPRLDTPHSLEKIGIPMLDVYGGEDFDWVLRAAPRLAAALRLAAGSTGHSQPIAASTPPAGTPRDKPPTGDAYRQVVIQGADHDYTGVTDELVDDILGWINRNAVAGTQRAAP